MLSLTVLIIVLNLSLGSMILWRARNISALLFFGITLAFSLLTIANYFSLTLDADEALFWIRLEMFFAAFHTFLFFTFVYEFMNDAPLSLRKKVYLAFTAFVPILYITLSPYLFSGVSVNALGEIETIPGILFPIFAFWLFAMMVISMRKTLVMYWKTEGVTKAQWRYVMYGTFATYLSIIASNFILAGMFRNTALLKYTPLYSLPLVVATAYAIVTHNLFNIKVLATQAFVVIISIVYFAKFLVSTNISDRATDGLILLATVVFGYMLVKSVKEEVRAREEVRELANQLAQTNWELAKSNEQLKIIDQRKSEFVSIVSHQLRTPITAIKGYSSLMLEETYGKLPDPFRDPITKIFHSAERLAKMVSEFLDISKIEQGTMTYDMKPVNILSVLTDLVDDFTSVANAKGLALEFHHPKNEHFVAVVDEGKIRQVFSNLIDNSIKYTRKGSIDITLKKNDIAGKITVEIRDTGIGLSHDDIHHLFGKFTRGTGGQRQNTEGSGLGLYVAKKMLEAQDGKIWIDSRGPDMGSVFTVELKEQSEDDSPSAQ